MGWSLGWEVENPGGNLRAYGWGFGISEGDYFILSNGDDTTRYRVENIRYMFDPPDQWFAVLVFDPRTQ